MTGTEVPEPIRRRQRRSAAAVVALAALAVLAPVLSQAAFTSSTSNTGRIGAAKDWAGPMIEIVDPGDAIRGTVIITALASDDGLGVASVALAWAPSESTAFTPLCTTTAAPYACSFNTVPFGEGEVDLRAVAIDKAGFSTTALLEGVVVDNVAPTGSIGTVPPLTGVVTIPVTAADTTSGVASVLVQRSVPLSTSWVTLCTDVEAPYGCRFDTTELLTGTLLDFRALITDVAGNTFTTAAVKNRTVSNLGDSVSVEDPGPFLRGTVAIDANANAGLLRWITSVRIQRQAVGGAWVDLCTDTTSPYACGWDTTTVPDGLYNLRAIATNNLFGSTTSAIVGPVRVDNTPVRGFDVQGGAIAGTANRVGPGDSLILTYTRPMQASSIVPGWTGAAPVAVVARLRDGSDIGLGGSDDTIEVVTAGNPAVTVNVGTINLRGNYAKKKKVAVFDGTLSMEAVTVDGVDATRLTLTFGQLLSGQLRTAGGTPTMVWTPSPSALDTTGIATSAAPVREQGPADRDV